MISKTVSATITKEKKDTKVGVEFIKNKQDGRIEISNIDTYSLFANSRLQVGMKVLKINDADMTRQRITVKDVYCHVNEATGKLTIIAAYQEEEEEGESETIVIAEPEYVPGDTNIPDAVAVPSPKPNTTSADAIPSPTTAPFSNTAPLPTTTSMVAALPATTAATAVSPASLAGTSPLPSSNIPTRRSPPPPPGVEPGGVWGTSKYIGNTTSAFACLGLLCCLSFGIPGCLIFFCPCDKRDTYYVNGKYFNASGEYIGKRVRNFKPIALH